MKEKKQFVPRLPAGVVEKLHKNTGGGRHKSSKDYRRHLKHRKSVLSANE